VAEEDFKLTPWFLIRHAPVGDVANGIYAHGDVDAVLPPLDDIMAMAADIPHDALWYASPMRRTLATGRAVQNQMSSSTDLTTDLTLEPSLREQNFGTWQGLPFDEMWQEIKDLPPHNWSYLAASSTPDKGESFLTVQTRVNEFISRTGDVDPGRPRVLVTHAGIIRAFIGIVLGLDPDKALSFGVNTFSLSHFLHQTGPNTGTGLGGEWQMKYFNRTYGEKHGK
jgi:alpha-ribazole phosphatase